MMTQKIKLMIAAIVVIVLAAVLLLSQSVVRGGTTEGPGQSIEGSAGV